MRKPKDGEIWRCKGGDVIVLIDGHDEQINYQVSASYVDKLKKFYHNHRVLIRGRESRESDAGYMSITDYDNCGGCTCGYTSSHEFDLVECLGHVDQEMEDDWGD